MDTDQLRKLDSMKKAESTTGEPVCGNNYAASSAPFFGGGAPAPKTTGKIVLVDDDDLIQMVMPELMRLALNSGGQAS
jgi:hypothetical protein